MFETIVISFLKALADFIKLDEARIRRFQRHMTEPLLTVAMLLALYIGFCTVREGGLIAGLRMAFLDSRETIIARDRELHNSLLQSELAHTARSDQLITQHLKALLDKSGTVARIRLGVIHNGVTGVTGMSLLKFDIANAVSIPGVLAGDMVQNQPMIGWSKYLPPMLAGHCIYYKVSEMSDTPGRSRLQAMGTAAVLNCPVIDVRNQLLGALFLQWSSVSEVPSDSAMDQLKAETISTGRQIAAALDLRLDR